MDPRSTDLGRAPVVASVPNRAQADLIGFTVRSRFTGTVFIVTRTDEKRGQLTVAGDGCWAALEAVTVIAPPADHARR